MIFLKRYHQTDFDHNILLEDFTIRNTPFWTIHPVFSKNIIARGLNIQAGTTNDDGFDPDSCTDVLLENGFPEDQVFESPMQTLDTEVF